MGTLALPVRGPLVSYLSTITLSRPPDLAAISPKRFTATSRPQPIPRRGSVQDDSELRVPQATSSETMALASPAAALAAGAGAARAGTASRAETASAAQDGFMRAPFGIGSRVRGRILLHLSHVHSRAMDTPLVRPGLTYEDLLALPHRGRRCEIFDGVLFESPVPSLPHQRTAQRLTRVFEQAVRDGSGVLSSGMDVVLAPGTVARPDLLLVLADHLDIVGDAVRGAPDLI